MQVSVYLDESGDLGWKFDAPYRNGGSSRYLTISAIIINHKIRHLLKRMMRDLYQKTATPTSQEVKFAHLNPEQRLWIANKLAAFKTRYGNDVHYCSMTVKKEKVMQHIRDDANKLYNYMIKLMLAGRLSAYEKTFFNVDQRSIKVESGRSLHDYLQTTLWFEYGSSSKLETIQCDSKDHLGVQLADILSGIVQSHFEDGKSDARNVLAVHADIRTLYF